MGRYIHGIAYMAKTDHFIMYNIESLYLQMSHIANAMTLLAIKPNSHRIH